MYGRRVRAACAEARSIKMEDIAAAAEGLESEPHACRV